MRSQNNITRNFLRWCIIMYVCIVLQVVHNLGLCIALWDIQKVEESFIFPGDGASHTIGMYRDLSSKNG